MAENDVVIFKVVVAPGFDEFSGLVARAREVARQEGLVPADVTRAVRKARRRA